MAITYVQRVGTHDAHPVGGLPTATCTLSATPGAGNLLTLGYMGAQFAPTSISDPKGNTWTVQRTTSGRAVCWTMQDVGHLISGDVISLTLAGNNFRYEIMIDEFSGVLATSPVDDDAISSFTSGTSRVYGLVTTTVTGDLIYAFDGIPANETSYTAGGSYTALAIYTDGTLSIEAEYLVTSTVGNVTPTTATGSATTTGASITVAFKAATGSTQTLNAVGGVASSEAFGTARLLSPQYISSAGAIRSKEAFGSGDTYDTAQVFQDFPWFGWQNSAFQIVVANAGGSVYGTAHYGGGAASLVTFASIVITVTGVGAILSAQAVGTPVLRVMGLLQTVRPAGIGSAEAVGRPSLFAVDLTTSSYGGIRLSDTGIFAAATIDANLYAGRIADTLLYAGALDDAPVYQEQTSDVLIEVGGLDDTPGH